MAILRLKYLLHLLAVLISFTVIVVDCVQKGVTRITDENWQQVLEGEWLLEFYAPWCPACKALVPTWEAIGDWAVDLDVNVASVDVTEEAGLSGRFMVTSLPSIYHVIDGQFRRYVGPRQENDIITFIEDRKFQDIDPVSSWRAPDSIAMGMVSFIFKVSMRVRVFHTIMTEEYGFPWWSTYGFVAVATIITGLVLGMVFHNVMTEKYGFPIWVTYGFLAIFTVAFGLILGLILVLLTDCCCPQKTHKNHVEIPKSELQEPAQEADDKKTAEEDDDDKKMAEEIDDKAEEEEVMAKDEEEVMAKDEEVTEESTLRQRKTGTNEDNESKGK